MENVTLVTGGASGIGRRIVQSRRSLGEFVIVLDRAPRPADLDCEYVQIDLSQVETLKQFLEGELTKRRPLRLVNCAGVALLGSLETIAPDDFLMTMNVNVLAPTLIAQACLPAMREARFGRIVNIASRAALGRALRTSYAGSKAALIAASRVWALELGRFAITVNAVAPGPIETDLYRQANPADDPATQKIRASIPVGRVGTVDDVAFATDFFLDERSGFVTGQVLYVCGGLTIGRVS